MKQRWKNHYRRILCYELMGYCPQFCSEIFHNRKKNQSKNLTLPPRSQIPQNQISISQLITMFLFTWIWWNQYSPLQKTVIVINAARVQQQKGTAHHSENLPFLKIRKGVLTKTTVSDRKWTTEWWLLVAENCQNWKYTTFHTPCHTTHWASDGQISQKKKWGSHGWKSRWNAELPKECVEGPLQAHTVLHRKQWAAEYCHIVTSVHRWLKHATLILQILTTRLTNKIHNQQLASFHASHTKKPFDSRNFIHYLKKKKMLFYHRRRACSIDKILNGTICHISQSRH